MDHPGQAGFPFMSPSVERNLSDFEVTVEYPAFAEHEDDDDGPTRIEAADDALQTVPDGSRPDIPVPAYLQPTQVIPDDQPTVERDDVRDAVKAAMAAASESASDIDTAVCPEPSEIRMMMAAPSPSLIIDARAIMSAYQRPQPQLLWAQKMAMQAVSLPAAPRKTRWWSRAASAFIGFADTIGGAIVDTSLAAVRWMRASALARKLRNRPCKCCGAKRANYDLYFDMPANVSADQVEQQVQARSWQLFRQLGAARSPASYVRVTIRRCRRCVDDTTAEVTIHHRGSGRIVARDMQLVDDESYFLLSLAS